MKDFSKDDHYSQELLGEEDINVFDSRGQTKLHRAIALDQGDLVKLLLARGADPTLRCGTLDLNSYELAAFLRASQSVLSALLLLDGRKHHPNLLLVISALKSWSALVQNYCPSVLSGARFYVLGGGATEEEEEPDLEIELGVKFVQVLAKSYYEDVDLGFLKRHLRDYVDKFNRYPDLRGEMMSGAGTDDPSRGYRVVHDFISTLRNREKLENYFKKSVLNLMAEAPSKKRFSPFLVRSAGKFVAEMFESRSISDSRDILSTLVRRLPFRNGLLAVPSIYDGGDSDLFEFLVEECDCDPRRVLVAPLVRYPYSVVRFSKVRVLVRNGAHLCMAMFPPPPRSPLRTAMRDAVTSVFPNIHGGGVPKLKCLSAIKLVRQREEVLLKLPKLLQNFVRLHGFILLYDYLE